MYQPAVAAKILQMLVNMSYDRGDYCSFLEVLRGTVGASRIIKILHPHS